MEPLKRLGSYNAGMTRQRRRWKERQRAGPVAVSVMACVPILGTLSRMFERSANEN